MRRRINRYIWIVAVWMLCGIGEAHAMSPQVSAPAAWRTTPTMSYQTVPTYEFRSTSSYAPVVGKISYSSKIYTPGAVSVMYTQRGTGSSNPWDDDGDPEGQELGQMETPVGEPLILLVFALLYLLGKRKGRKIALFG